MRTRLTSLAVVLSLVLGGSAVAQEYAGPVVDRNVGDTGPNSASQRYLQPGLGQFGVGSLLLDRYDRSPHQFDRFNPIVGDGRTSHRYLMKSPGVSALMNRPDYIGPSPRGGWVLNQQTFDGSEILTYGPDTVFVLSRELLAPPTRKDEIDTSWLQHPNRVQPTTVGDPNQIMRDTRVTGQRRNTSVNNHPAVQHDPNYVHPEIIERRKRWKAEREAERKAAEQEAAEHDAKPQRNKDVDADQDGDDGQAQPQS